MSRNIKCSSCNHCQGYYRTKRRDTSALVNYYCEHPQMSKKPTVEQFIVVSREGVGAKMRTTPRWCPRKKEVSDQSSKVC